MIFISFLQACTRSSTKQGRKTYEDTKIQKKMKHKIRMTIKKNSVYCKGQRIDNIYVYTQKDTRDVLKQVSKSEEKIETK